MFGKIDVTSLNINKVMVDSLFQFSKISLKCEMMKKGKKQVLYLIFT